MKSVGHKKRLPQISQIYTDYYSSELSQISSKITKRIATFFILSPIFSCEIKIFFSKSLEIQ